MSSFLDFAFVALFAAVLPLWDYLYFWPAFRRLSAVEPARARLRLCRQSLAFAWPTVAVGAAIWTAPGRSWASLGFTVPQGWRLWVSLGLVVLLIAYYAAAIASVAGSAEARAKLRQQIGGLTAVVPHTRQELYWFSAVSLTAGFCEEFLYRGFFVQALAPWLGIWGATALSLAGFGLGHLYQGWSGVLRTAIVGALYTLVVVVTGSLWPAIALHALVDLGSGVLAWLGLRDASDDD